MSPQPAVFVIDFGNIYLFLCKFYDFRSILTYLDHVLTVLDQFSPVHKPFWRVFVSSLATHVAVYSWSNLYYD